MQGEERRLELLRLADWRNGTLPDGRILRPRGNLFQAYYKTEK